MKAKVPLPREHGAWAILYGSFALGCVATPEFSLPPLLLLLAITGLFLAQEPLARLIRSRDAGVSAGSRASWRRWLIAWLTLSLVTGLVLVLAYRRWMMVPAGLAAAVLLASHLFLASKRRDRSLAGEIQGVIGLTAAAPATQYVLSGAITSLSLLLWLFALLYFGSGVFCVRMRISRFLAQAKYSQRRRSCLLYHGALVLAVLAAAKWTPAPALLPIAFAPAVGRALWFAWQAEERLDIRRIGYSEVGHTVLFLLLFGLAWHAG